jgi:hypothetical protein
MDSTSIVRVGGVCALLGVAAGLVGSAVGAVHGLGGQEIPLGNSADFLSLTHNQGSYLAREWFFLLYAIFAVGEGVGLYYLTRPAGSLALWALVAWSVAIVIGIVQDAALVAFVQQFPTEYAGADETTRLALEPLARTLSTLIGVQQSVANALLGISVTLYSVAILRTGVVSRWFGAFGFASAAASLSFAVVTAFALASFRTGVEHAFGLVVAWDAWAGIVMLHWRKLKPLTE